MKHTNYNFLKIIHFNIYLFFLRSWGMFKITFIEIQWFSLHIVRTNTRVTAYIRDYNSSKKNVLTIFVIGFHLFQFNMWKNKEMFKQRVLFFHCAFLQNMVDTKYSLFSLFQVLFWNVIHILCRISSSL